MKFYPWELHMRNVISLNQNWKFIKTAENAICAAQQNGEDVVLPA